MKSHLLLLLILISCYHLSTAQVATDNGTTITLGNNSSSSGSGGPNNFVNIPSQQVDNNPFILGLIDYGSQVVVGQVADSQLTYSYYHTGNYSKIYAVSADSNNAVNLTADVQLNLFYGALIHAIFTVHFDPSNNLRQLLSFSYEWQTYNLTSSNGVNVSYDASNDLFDVVNFRGFNEALTYQNQDNSGQTSSYSTDEFLSEFGNWTSVNASSLYDNQTVQYAFNAALRGLRTKSYYSNILAYNYTTLNVTALNSIYTYSIPNTSDYFRYDFVFNTDLQKGRAVCVVTCPMYNQYYPPYWPPYYPVYPLDVNDGVISSTAGTENAGNTATNVNTAQTTMIDQEVQAQIVKPTVDEAPQNATGSDAVAPDDGTSTGEPLIIDTPGGPSYYYNYNCLYGSLDYNWFIEIQDA